MNPQANAKTGKPRLTARRHAKDEPVENGELKNTTTETEAELITAWVRLANLSFNSPLPPADQLTKPPRSENATTPETADNEQAPAALGPKAAKQEPPPEGKTESAN